MNSLRYVGFWYRVFASVVDTALYSLLMGVLMLMAYGQDYSGTWEYVYAEEQRAGILELLGTWLLPAVVTLLFWEYKSATPGKMLISARIVDARTARHPTPLQWVIRYVGYFLSALALGLGFLWVAFDPRKQGWHDKLANTVVVFPTPDRATWSEHVSRSQAEIQTQLPSTDVHAMADVPREP